MHTGTQADHVRLTLGQTPQGLHGIRSASARLLREVVREIDAWGKCRRHSGHDALIGVGSVKWVV